MLQYHHFVQIDSTNAYLQRQQSECDIRNWVVSADEQTAGKGMGNNGWESEVGKNLTFSLAVGMGFLPAERQFQLSKAVPLGIIEMLDGILPPEKLSIKWPNDIYYGNRKLAGILGLNVNQTHFQDWPTRPVSMKMITGKEYDLQLLLEQIAERIIIKVKQLKNNPTSIEHDYLKRLFRYRTWAEYEVKGETLRLFMTGIDPFGRLMMRDESDNSYCFDIKEIKFLL